MSRNQVGLNTLDPLNETAEEFGEKKGRKLMELEGECKIQSITLLKLSLLKAIPLTLLATCTVIGLLMIFWYKWFRVKLWFVESNPYEATHAYLESGPGTDDIEPIQREQNQSTFYFKKLQYRLRGKSPVPMGFDYEQNFTECSSEKYLSKGLDPVSIRNSLDQFGLNQHKVEIPNYFSFMLDVLLKPFFLLQYIVCIAFFIQGFTTFGVINIGFSIVTTSINYILAYFSFKKIKDMAEKVVDVRVLRNGAFLEVKSNELVPGDLIDPVGEIMCDCILLRGEIYVNEASLTGESMPIGKFTAAKIEQTSEDNRWLFEGSKVVEKKDTVLALVVNTGYTTRRGRIIRKILTRVSGVSEIFKSALLFELSAFIVAMIIYFATIAFMSSKNISSLIVGFRFIDFLGWSVPPSFPIYFNIAYSFAIVRLKASGILCIEPEKTVEACNLKIMCFDKTGTLTENTVEVHQVFKIKDADNINDITEQVEDDENALVFKLFATCHTTKHIDGKFLGDEVDLRMFLFSEYEMSQSQDPSVRFEVKHPHKKHHLEVLRINQFESRFQSMSVLVRDRIDSKIYAFIKGAPEKIEKNSVLKVHGYDKVVSGLSLGGYRTIGCGYRVVPQGQVKKYLEEPREVFEHGITALSLVAFENKLKHDTRQTIDRLVEGGIEPKIITGDNIFIAVETGVRAGVISAHDKVVLLEGRKQPKQTFQQGFPRKFKGILLTRHAATTIEQPIELTQDQSYLSQPYPMAIDNDFLTLDPPPVLTNNMKLFARISPENKALVVTKFKQTLDQEFNVRSLLSRTCGELKSKVGMCGDGANDLMAIRQADVGMGINDSDASYGATFAIVNMMDVDQIVRDSKATTANIIQIIRYYEFISFLKIPASLLMIMDTAYYNEGMLLFMNFTCTIIYPIFQAMGRPTWKVTRLIPNGNLFGPVSQLRFWGSLIISTGGLIACYFYFRSTSNFAINRNQVVIRTWNPANYTNTCLFITMLPYITIYSVFFYIGEPWKQKIYRNTILFILIVLNLGSAVTMHYITSFSTRALGTLPIRSEIASVLLLIGLAGCALGYIYNYIITEVIAGCGAEEQPRLALQEDKQDSIKEKQENS